MSPLATQRLTSARLVNRTAELTLLDDILRRTIEGEPAHMVVAGPAGVGKTRLVRELAVRAGAADTLVLSGDCIAVAGAEIPYAPIGAALRQMRRDALEEALAALGAGVLGELAHVFPDLVSGPGAVRESVAQDFAQARLFGSLLALLRQLTAAAPVLLVIEDLQWADASSRDFLRFLIHNLREERLGTVMTVRDDEVDDTADVRLLLDELRVETLELGPLTADCVEALLEAILGRPPTAELQRQIFERSEGVPFFVEALAAAGASAGPGLERRLLARLLLRVKPLAPRTQDVLRVVAGAGRPIDYALLSAAADIGDDELLAALREAVDRSVLVHDPSTGRYAFRHALLREAVYEQLHDPERRRLHAHLAAALDERRTPDNAPERAHHWDAAGDAGAALDASLEAALAAEEVYAWGEALRHFRRAAELWDAGGGDMPMDRVEALARGAEAARISGDYDAAKTLCLEALGHLDHSADPGRAARLYERLGRYHFHRFDAALAAYIEAQRLLPEGRTAQRARLLGDEALTLSFMARFDEARDRAREAIAIAQEAAAPEEEGAARVVLGTALAFLGDPGGGERELREGLRLSNEAGNAQDIGRGYVELGEVMRIQGRFDAALEVMREGEAEVQRYGRQDSDGSFMAVNAAEDLLRLGRWEETRTQLDELSRRRLGPTAKVLYESVAGRLDVACGRFDDAEAEFARVRELWQPGGPTESLPAVYAGWAESFLWRGDPAGASERVREGFAAIGDAVDPLNMPVLFNVGARAAADAGDPPAAAEELLVGLEELLRQHSIGGFVPPDSAAHLAACRAEVARARGEPGAELWTAARSAWERVGQPYPAAYAAWREGEARLLDDRQRAAASEPLRAAASAAERLGAGPLRQRVLRLAEWGRLDLGERAPAAAAVAPAPAGLTARELQVLRLIAEGLTDREIAERLVISVKTASHHVSHILGKLNARGRVEAASKAQQLGLLEPGEQA